MQQMVGAQVKITEQPFLVSNAQHLNQIVWTMIGNTIKVSKLINTFSINCLV